ncbi:MAG: hypothetical protein IJP48_03435 [Synergistaceae bacterium]|nr:hypothetical protein [Synergistaceae bacterium]
MSVKQISIFLEHKPGSLYDLTMTLAENDINIRALTVAETGDMALIRLLVDNFLWTASLLKNSGYHATFNDVIVAKISNVPGGLNHILEVLYAAKINIEHTYSIMTSKNALNNVERGVLMPTWFLRLTTLQRLLMHSRKQALRLSNRANCQLCNSNINII